MAYKLGSNSNSGAYDGMQKTGLVAGDQSIFGSEPKDKKKVKVNRKGETIPLSYLIKCHQYHEEWLDTTKANTSRAPPSLLVNCNSENTPKTILLWQQQLEKFITQILIW